MTFRRELLDKLEITPANGFVIAVRGQTQDGVGVDHEKALLRVDPVLAVSRQPKRIGLTSFFIQKSGPKVDKKTQHL